MNKRPFILPLAILLLLILIFSGRALLPGRLFVPTDLITERWPPWQEPNSPAEVHNLLLTDVVNYILPVKTFMAEAVRRGELPLWNPYIFTGYPFTYNTQAGLFYPLSLFYYLLPTPLAVDATVIGQLVLGAWFIVIYLRRLRLHWLAVTLGGVLFVFNGAHLVWLEWQVVYAAVIWLPAQLYVVERLREESGVRAEEDLTHEAGNLRLLGAEKKGDFATLRLGVRQNRLAKNNLLTTPWPFLLAILFAIPWLGGHWNWTLYTSLTLGLYMLLRLPRWQNVWLTAVSLGAGSVMTLVQVWPAFRYLSQTHRLPIPFWELLRFGIGDRAAVFFVPNFFGNSIAQNWWGSAISNEVETAVYFSILAPLLGLIALATRRDWHTRFFGVWGGVTLLWTLGTPAYGLLYILPVFNGLQPSRAGFMTVFCLTMLAALGLDQLLTSEVVLPKLTRVWGSGVILGLLVVAGFTAVNLPNVQATWSFLRWELAFYALFLLGSVGVLVAYQRGVLRGAWLGALAVVWITADLWRFGFNFNTIGHVEQLYPETETALYLQNDLANEPSRIVTLADGVVFYPNTALAERIPNFSGYEPGVPRRLLNYMATAEAGEPLHFERILMPAADGSSSLLKAMNVKHIVTIRERWGAEAVLDVAAEAAGEWVAVGGERPFTMSDAGLQRIDLPLRRMGPATGEVVVRVLAADGGQEFANARLSVAELDEAGAMHSFFFSPFPSEWGRDFLLRLSLEGEGSVEVGATAAGELAFAAWRLPRPALAHEAGKTRIYLNEGYLPRAYAVGEALLAADEADALRLLQENAERLDEVVVLEADAQTLSLGDGQGGAVTIEEYGLIEVRLTAVMEGAGWVVLSDSFDAGWVAMVDGEERPIVRANSLGRAVFVENGRSEIIFRYRPTDFFVGGALSGGMLLVVLMGLVLTAKNRPGKSRNMQN